MANDHCLEGLPHDVQPRQPVTGTERWADCERRRLLTSRIARYSALLAPLFTLATRCYDLSFQFLLLFRYCRVFSLHCPSSCLPSRAAHRHLTLATDTRP